MDVRTKLLDALEAASDGRGVEVLDLELVGSRRAPTVRIYLDAPGGVSFDELAGSQEWINEVMEALDPFPGAYTLEVSSPGIDRPLRKPEHFAAAVGETVSVKAKPQEGNRSNFKGELASFEDGTATVVVDGTAFAIPFEDIKRAHIVGTVDFNA